MLSAAVVIALWGLILDIHSYKFTKWVFFPFPKLKRIYWSLQISSFTSGRYISMASCENVSCSILWDPPDMVLTLSTLGIIFSRKHFEIFFFSYFPRKRAFTFHTNCKNCQSLFSGKNKKNITNVLSAELAQRVVKAKTLTTVVPS